MLEVSCTKHSKDVLEALQPGAAATEGLPEEQQKKLEKLAAKRKKKEKTESSDDDDTDEDEKENKSRRKNAEPKPAVVVQPLAEQPVMSQQVMGPVMPMQPGYGGQQPWQQPMQPPFAGIQFCTLYRGVYLSKDFQFHKNSH